MGDFVIFSYFSSISRLEGFLYSVAPQGDRNSGRNSGKKSEKTPETLSELFLEFASRVRLGSPKPYNSRHLKAPEHFQNSLPPPVRLGKLPFSEVVSDRASRSRSWNSQEYWGYFARTAEKKPTHLGTQGPPKY